MLVHIYKSHKIKYKYKNKITRRSKGLPPGGRGRLNGVCVLIHLLLETDNLTSANKMWISLELEITLNWLLSEKEENLPNIVSFLPPSKSRLDIRKMGSALGPMGRERPVAFPSVPARLWFETGHEVKIISSLLSSHFE